MTGAAYFADQADRLHDRMLARCWAHDPPQKRERRPGEGRRFRNSDGTDDKPAYTPTRAGLQDARRLDRQADLVLSLERHRAPDRLAHTVAAVWVGGVT